MQLLAEPTPTTNYIIDDAGALSKTTRKAISDKLKRLEFETGYRIEAVTVRKLEVEADAFAFTDRLIESWCAPTAPVPRLAAPLASSCKPRTCTQRRIQPVLKHPCRSQQTLHGLWHRFMPARKSELRRSCVCRFP